MSRSLDNHVSTALDLDDQTDADWIKSSPAVPLSTGIRKQIGEGLSHME